jgi:hypothetical protein
MIHPPLRFLLWALGLALLGLKLLDLYGQWRWHQKTQTLYDRLGAEASRSANRNPPRVDFRELQPLPEIVQRYLGQVLTEGQPLMTTVIAQHQGQFNLGAETPRWFPFTSQQRISLHPAGFVWNGRITVLPGLVQIWVHDAYVEGEGILTAALGGWATLMTLRDRQTLAQGELQRFLAEAVWYPTAFLPSQGAIWTAMGENMAQVTLQEGSIVLEMTVEFNEQGLIDRLSIHDRMRAVGKGFSPTHWECRVWNYQRHGTLLIPQEGEVAWILPEGRYPYWRGTLTALEYR